MTELQRLIRSQAYDDSENRVKHVPHIRAESDLGDEFSLDRIADYRPHYYGIHGINIIWTSDIVHYRGGPCKACGGRPGSFCVVCSRTRTNHQAAPSGAPPLPQVAKPKKTKALMGGVGRTKSKKPTARH